MDYREKLESKFPEMLEFARSLMRIRSVKDDPLPGAPFGEGCRRALDAALAKARELGFEEIFDADGYAGHAQSAGTGDPLAILVHLDVVPEGSGWMYPPYESVIADGRLYGRGALDDKGPLAAVLYAAYAVRSTVGFNRPVRIIFGCDEESGWADIDHYVSVAEMPEEGFSPDSDFPVVNAEKGIAHYSLKGKFFEYFPGLFRLVSVKGGDRVNVVPNTARAELFAVGDPDIAAKAALTYSNEHDVNVDVLVSGRDVTVTAHGKSAHGSTPDCGVNAAAILLDFLTTALDIGSGDAVRCMSEYVRLFKDKLHGEAFGMDVSDEESGRLTMNFGSIALDTEGSYAEVDIRYPVTAELKPLEERFASALSASGTAVTLKHDQKPLFVPKDSPLVNALLGAYNRTTGKNAVPVSMGGGTYARALKRGVAFGPIDEGMNANEHEPNEYIRIEDLNKAAYIYAEAIYTLTR